MTAPAPNKPTLSIETIIAELDKSTRMHAKLTLAGLHGMVEARAWGLKLARDLTLFRQGSLAWKDVDPACLLHGPPGTGKTTFAKALAASCGVPLVATSYSDWQSTGEGHLGSTITAMTAAFSEAIAAKPAILFIDELDSLPKRRGGDRSDYWNAAVNAVLKEFDRLKSVEGVVVVGACNHPEILDPALVRSGRMDRMIRLSLPTAEEIEGILCYHLSEDEIAALLENKGPPLDTNRGD